MARLHLKNFCESHHHLESKMQNKHSRNIFQLFVHKLDNINFGIGKERDYFVENLSMIVSSGMSILSAISAVEQEVRSRSMKRVLKVLRDDIESGSPLWKAFQKARIFSDHTISLVRIGEESGKLSQNLKLIAEQDAKERALRSKIRSAMMYPVFVMSITVIIGVAIALFILPRLASVFLQLRIDLPFLTKVLIVAGKFLGDYGHIAFPIIFFVLGVIIYFVFYYSETKFIGQKILFSFPGVKELLQEVELTRFGYLLGTLINAGLPVTTALDSLQKATLFLQYKSLYTHLRDSIDEGNSFQKSFLKYRNSSKLIPVTIQQLLFAGELSGNLSDTLLKISVTYEVKAENTTKNLTIILEPILLVIVWLGVVSVALAVIIPIYSLIGGFNNESSENPEQIITIEEAKIVKNVIEESTSSTSSITEMKSVNKLRILSTGIGYLNVRDKPTIQGEVINKIQTGEIFEYTNDDGGWYKIILYDGKSGWVFKEYVEIIKTQ